MLKFNASQIFKPINECYLLFQPVSCQHRHTGSQCPAHPHYHPGNKIMCIVTGTLGVVIYKVCNNKKCFLAKRRLKLHNTHTLLDKR